MTDAVHVACPYCDAINRLPRARIESRPRCGKCHQPLFHARPVALSSANFEKHCGGDLPVLVEFWAPWCGYCQKMAPAFTHAASQLEPRMRLATVNTEVEKVLAARYAIKGLPTMILFRKGQEVARQAGAVATADIVHWARLHG